MIKLEYDPVMGFRGIIVYEESHVVEKHPHTNAITANKQYNRIRMAHIKRTNNINKKTK